VVGTAGERERKGNDREGVMLLRADRRGAFVAARVKTPRQGSG
jgi:hypothetical protein